MKSQLSILPTKNAIEKIVSFTLNNSKENITLKEV